MPNILSSVGPMWAGYMEGKRQRQMYDAEQAMKNRQFGLQEKEFGLQEAGAKARQRQLDQQEFMRLTQMIADSNTPEQLRIIYAQQAAALGPSIGAQVTTQTLLGAQTPMSPEKFGAAATTMRDVYGGGPGPGGETALNVLRGMRGAEQYVDPWIKAQQAAQPAPADLLPAPTDQTFYQQGPQGGGFEDILKGMGYPVVGTTPPPTQPIPRVPGEAKAFKPYLPEEKAGPGERIAALQGQNSVLKSILTNQEYMRSLWKTDPARVKQMVAAYNKSSAELDKLTGIPTFPLSEDMFAPPSEMEEAKLEGQRGRNELTLAQADYYKMRVKWFEPLLKAQIRHMEAMGSAAKTRAAKTGGGRGGRGPDPTLTALRAATIAAITQSRTADDAQALRAASANVDKLILNAESYEQDTSDLLMQKQNLDSKAAALESAMSQAAQGKGPGFTVNVAGGGTPVFVPNPYAGYMPQGGVTPAQALAATVAGQARKGIKAGVVAPRVRVALKAHGVKDTDLEAAVTRFMHQHYYPNWKKKGP